MTLFNTTDSFNLCINLIPMDLRVSIGLKSETMNRILQQIINTWHRQIKDIFGKFDDSKRADAVSWVIW